MEEPCVFFILKPGEEHQISEDLIKMKSNDILIIRNEIHLCFKFFDKILLRTSGTTT